MIKSASCASLKIQVWSQNPGKMLDAGAQI